MPIWTGTRAPAVAISAWMKSRRGTWLICEVCWWEDDPVQFEDPEYRGGANGPSLNEARRYFRTIGFSGPEHLARMRREDPSRLPK
jgi:hypothetical protein